MSKKNQSLKQIFDSETIRNEHIIDYHKFRLIQAYSELRNEEEKRPCTVKMFTYNHTILPALERIRL